MHLTANRSVPFVLEVPGDDNGTRGSELPNPVAAARYVELNPVRAKLVVAPSQYRWSNVRADLKGKDDGLVRVGPLLAIAGSLLFEQ
jgi:hypothetical protein